MSTSHSNVLSQNTLTVTNACTTLAEGLAAISAGHEAIDLAPLKTVDSAAVAVLLAWARAAHVAGRTVRFDNVPTSLRTLAVLYGVNCLIGIPDADVQAEPGVPQQHH